MRNPLTRRGGYPMPPVPDGFYAGAVPLPSRPPGSPPARRLWHAALIVHGIALGATPEDLAAGLAPDLVASFLEPLAREEALAHVDVLLNALAPVAAP